MLTKPITTAFAVLVLAGLLGACGDDDGSDDAGPVSLDDGAAGDPTSDDGDDSDDGEGSGGDVRPPDEDFQDAMLEYAECMRDHGIDMPDPEVNGEGGVLIGPGPDGQEPRRAEQEEFAAADEECNDILEDATADAPPIDPEQQAELQDQLLEVAECMRARGHDMPDPEVDEQGRVQIGIGGDVGQPGEAEFEEFQQDMEECQEEVGVDGPGGGFRTGRADSGDEDEEGGA